MENATKKLAAMAYRPLERTETLRGMSRASLEAHVKDMEMKCTRLVKELEQVKRERDAAVEDIYSMKACALCKHYPSGEECETYFLLCIECENEKCICKECSNGEKMEWRGVRKD